MEFVADTFKVERNVIGYRCDHCGKVIGKATEYEDGYVPIPDGCHEVKDISIGINYSDDSWTIGSKYRIHLCDDCYKELEGKISNFADKIKKEYFEKENL